MVFWGCRAWGRMAFQAGKRVDVLGTVYPARVGLACPGELFCSATSFDRVSIVCGILF